MKQTNKNIGDYLRQFHVRQLQKHCTKLPRDKRAAIADLINQIIEILKTKEV